MYRVKLIFLMCVSLILAFRVTGEIVYKDSESPTGVPDFNQDGGVCSEVAMANCLWFFDHHGFSSLVPHSDGDPGEWETDSQALIDQLEGLVRGDDGDDGLGSVRGVESYIRSRGKHWVRGEQGGLVVKLYGSDEATYTLFQHEIERSQDVIPWLKAHKEGEPEGVYLEVGDDSHDWFHAMTAAGWDDSTPPEKVALTNGWRNTEGENAENENLVDEDNYEIASIQDPATNGDKLRITDVPGVDGIPPAGSDYLEMVNMMTICPVDKDGAARNVEGAATRDETPGETPVVIYEYSVENLTDDSGTNEPISAVGIAIDVPFDFDALSVQSPPGWSAREWVASTTPGLVPPSPFLDPDDFNALDPPDIGWRGVLWTTATAPVLPEATLSGFSFQLPDRFTISADGSYRALSSSADDLTGILDVGFTMGPTEPSTVAIPTLGTFGLVLLAILVAGALVWYLRKRPLSLAGDLDV